MVRVSVVARIVIAVWLGVTCAGALEAAAQPQPPAAQDEFVPIDEIPPEDQLPAAPLLIGAYAVAWVAILGYVWVLWRKLDRVEADLRALRERTSGRDAGRG